MSELCNKVTIEFDGVQDASMSRQGSSDCAKPRADLNNGVGLGRANGLDDGVDDSGIS
jgi:hypothetical protein